MAGGDQPWPRRLAPLAVFAAASLAAAASFGGVPEPDARFAAFLDDVYRQRLERSPMLAAEAGAGEPTAAWDDLSESALDAELRQIRANLDELRTSFDPEELGPQNRSTASCRCR